MYIFCVYSHETCMRNGITEADVARYIQFVDSGHDNNDIFSHFFEEQ